MGRARKARQVKTIDPKPHKCNYKYCRKKYKTISSLNNHKRIKHEDIRWKCPFCDEEQVSKDKHSLHIERKHSTECYSNMNLDKNQIRKNQLTNKAKDAKIADQQKRIDKQLDLITRYKTKLITAKLELRETKKKLKAANQKLTELDVNILEEEKSKSDETEQTEDSSSESDDSESENENEDNESDRSAKSADDFKSESDSESQVE